MQYRRVGISGLKLSAVSLGLWHNFGGANNYDTMRGMISAAFDSGITHFDLANNYGPPPGSAEENFGRILKADFASHRDEMIISTKAGYNMWEGPYGEWGSRKYMLASLDQSLKRLGLDYVDIFYSHRFDPDTPLEETMSALSAAVHQGKALYAGISNYNNPENTERAYKILEGMGVRLLIHQPAYSMLNRAIEAELLGKLDELGVGSVAYNPLAQGILTNKYLNGIPENSRAKSSSPFLNEPKVESEIEKVKLLNEIAISRGQTMAQTALAWTLRSCTSALIGASSPEQIFENVKAIEKLEFTKDEIDRIDEITKTGNK